MNISKQLKKQLGIGLIEVLIALLVVALGVLGLSKLQGSMLRAGGDSKAYTEAVALAQEKIEEFRDSSTVTEYNAIVSGTDNATGINAAYALAWTVTDETSFIGPTAPPRKEISVQVSWRGVDGNTQKVYTSTEIAWIDPAKSALYSSEGSGTAAVPSPRQNASEDVASEDVIASSSDITGGDGTSSEAGIATYLSLDAVVLTDAGGAQILNQTSVTVTQIAPNSHFYATDNTAYSFVEPGVIAVFECKGNASVGSCTYIQNHFGGVVHRISGTVSSMSGETLANIQVVWSSSDVNACYQDSTYTTSIVSKTGYNGNSTTLQTMGYECVFAGNCDATTRTVGTDGIGQGNHCSTNVTDAHIADRNVGPGGEFGEVGLLGVDYQGGNREMVCFLEDTADHTASANVLTYGAASGTQYDEAYILPVTKRSYLARRRKADNTQITEGVNRSFTNHNFLILDRATGGGTSETCHDLIALNSSNTNMEVAPRQMVRTLSGTNNNIVAVEEAYAGGTAPALTLTGTVSASTDLNLYVSTSEANNSQPGSCYIKSDGTAYACIVPGGTTTVTVQGANDSKPNAATSHSSCSNISVTGSGSISCDWTGSFSP